MKLADMRASTVDRTERTDLFHYDELPSWAETKWHRPRPCDDAVAVCSSRIILNPEDEVAADTVPPGSLCRRCFREGSL